MKQSSPAFSHSQMFQEKLIFACKHASSETFWVLQKLCCQWPKPVCVDKRPKCNIKLEVFWNTYVYLVHTVGMAHPPVSLICYQPLIPCYQHLPPWNAWSQLIHLSILTVYSQATICCGAQCHREKRVFPGLFIYHRLCSVCLCGFHTCSSSAHHPADLPV